MPNLVSLAHIIAEISAFKQTAKTKPKAFRDLY